MGGEYSSVELFFGEFGIVHFGTESVEEPTRILFIGRSPGEFLGGDRVYRYIHIHKVL